MSKVFNIFRFDPISFSLTGLILAGLFLVLAFSTTASATSLLPINLQQLSTRASLIFYGEVVSNQTKKDPQSGHIATFTKFNIIESIKGEPGKGELGKGEPGQTHTIKQLGGYDEASDVRLRIHGVPEFKTGNRYIVFLPEKSSLGFCSPLGLHQGSFSVYSSEGETIVSNGHETTAPVDYSPASYSRTAASQTGHSDPEPSSILVPLPVRTHNPTQSRLDDFINTVRAYNTP